MQPIVADDIQMESARLERHPTAAVHTSYWRLDQDLNCLVCHVQQATKRDYVVQRIPCPDCGRSAKKRLDVRGRTFAV